MSVNVTSANVKEVTLEATIIRADGRVERLGTIAHWHKNPLVRLWRQVVTFLFRR